MVEKVDVYSDKSNGSKIYAFDYLRVIALVMILYDHLGGFYNPNWIVKKSHRFLFCGTTKHNSRFWRFWCFIVLLA